MSVRLAPSPTGRFHIGNLRTALASQIWAEALGWPLVVRFEDIDKPRVLPRSQQQQLDDLNKIGIQGFRTEVQSHNHQRHFTVFQEARATKAIYPCFCSRKELQSDLAGMASAPHSPLRAYSGRCRGLTDSEVLKKFQERSNQTADHKQDVGWRFAGPDPSGADDILVARTANLQPEITDFIPSYQWACSIDDLLDGHRLLIRAWDLESSVLPQRLIQGWLIESSKKLSPLLPELSQPRLFPAVFHTALVTQSDGSRLEKRTPGVTLEDLDPQEIREQLLASLNLHDEVWNRKQFGQSRIWGEKQRQITWPSRQS